MRPLNAILLFFAIASFGCHHTPRNEQALTLQVADELVVAFRPDANRDSLLNADGWRRLDNGRLCVKSFDGPVYDQQPTCQIHMTLRSVGDPWDKSGLVAIWPDSPEVRESLAHGDAPNIPALELLRFITPFGVGHFSHEERLDEYRPVYIPEWADSVHWTADITPILSQLEGTFHLGIFIDTWSDAGHACSIRLDWLPTTAQVHPKRADFVLPLLNTTKLFERQETFTAFAAGPVHTRFHLGEALEETQLFLTTTGHGGHGDGDEFTPCEHIVVMDSTEVGRFTPWRNDCASFRRFNPSSGVWTEKTLWRGDSIQERIASSDYSRSGWCPGSDVPPREFHLGKMDSGWHEFTIHIPSAQPYRDGEANFFNVAAHITGKPAH